MTSPPPLQHGSYYHVYNRGNNRKNIFFEERNYRYFLKLYTKYIEPVAFTYAYCLLQNHFHLLVRTRTVEEQAQTLKVSKTFRVLEPSQQFANLFNAYAKAINKAYNRTGSLFEHPFGRIPITTDAHFVHLVAYIHHNPQKHGFVDDFQEWRYSSYHALKSQAPTRLQRDDVLAWFGGQRQLDEYHNREMNARLIAYLVADDQDPKGF